MDKLQASSFYQHFADNERPTIDYFVGLFNQVLFKKSTILTDFLNPREQIILQTIVGQQLQLEFSGGYQGAERKRAFINDFVNYDGEPDFALTALEVEYNRKFITLKHGDIYGALNNIGLEQGVYGDIIHDENSRWQFFVKNENTADIITQIERIGRNKVRLVELEQKNIIQPVDEGTTNEVLLSSARLDSIISTVAKISRSQAKDAIESGQVKLNWLVVNDPTITLGATDMVSLRHFGRFKLITELGETKRGKHRFQIEQWLSKKR